MKTVISYLVSKSTILVVSNIRKQGGKKGKFKKNYTAVHICQSDTKKLEL